MIENLYKNLIIKNLVEMVYYKIWMKVIIKLGRIKYNRCKNYNILKKI